MEEAKLPPLGKLLNLIETLGYTVSHHYEDLVFVDNTAFLFRLNPDNKTIHLHFNADCKEAFSKQLTNKAIVLAKQEGIERILRSEDFKIKQNEGTEEIQIIFQ